MPPAKKLQIASVIPGNTGISAATTSSSVAALFVGSIPSSRRAHGRAAASSRRHLPLITYRIVNQRRHLRHGSITTPNIHSRHIATLHLLRCPIGNPLLIFSLYPSPTTPLTPSEPPTGPVFATATTTVVHSYWHRFRLSSQRATPPTPWRNLLYGSCSERHSRQLAKSKEQHCATADGVAMRCILLGQPSALLPEFLVSVPRHMRPSFAETEEFATKDRIITDDSDTPF